MKHLYLLLYLIPSLAWGQSDFQIVRGVVYDAYDKTPLPLTKLTLEGVRTGWTNQEGVFELYNVLPGQYILQLEKVGYISQRMVVLVEQHERDTTMFYLSPTSYNFEDYVVLTAQRKKESPVQSPQALTIVDQQQLFERGARTLPEGLMGAAGVWVQKTNHGGGSPFVRGLTGHQTLILVDGIRLNNSTFRSGPNQYTNTIDQMMLERVEIARGTGSVQYGSDALGGVLNFISQTPVFSPQGMEVHGSATARYGSTLVPEASEILEQTVRGQLSFATDRVATGIGINLKRYGDIIAGDTLGRQAPSGYDQTDIDFNSRLKIGESNLLTLAFQQTNQEGVGRYDQVSQLGQYEQYQFDPQLRQLAYLRFEHSGEEQWTGTVSYQRHNEGRLKRRTDATQEQYEQDEVRTLGVTAQHQGQVTKNWTAVSGAEVYADQINSSLEVRRDDDTVMLLRGLYPDGSSALNVGLFSLHEYKKRNWLIQAGLRANLMQVTAPDSVFGDIQTSPIAIVGNVGASYLLRSGVVAYANINSGFRAPNLNDLTSFGAFDFGFEVPNPDLRPERTLSGELGMKVSQPNWSIALSGYYTRLFQLMVREKSAYQGDTLYQAQRVYQKVNLAQAYMYGAEASVEYRLSGGLSAYGQATYTFGADEAGNPLRRIPPFNGQLGLALRRPAGYFIRVENWWAADQTRLASGDVDDHRIPAGGTPGFSVLNAHMGYQLRWVQANVTVHNLFNTAYRFHGSGVDGMGRSVWVTLVAEF